MTTSSSGPAVDRDGTIEPTATGGVIRFERRLAHPIDEVWAAITEPARLADWWLPFPADITVDLRPGGLMVMTATGDEPITITCEVLRVEPPHLFEHTHVDADSGSSSARVTAAFCGSATSFSTQPPPSRTATPSACTCRSHVSPPAWPERPSRGTGTSSPNINVATLQPVWRRSRRPSSKDLTHVR